MERMHDDGPEHSREAGRVDRGLCCRSREDGRDVAASAPSILFVHHVTWSINSICHIWGQQPFKSNDESRNNAFFGILGLGKGWHNTHHAFPTSARHGLRWWQIDVSFWVIRLLERFGLAWNVKVPSRAAISSNRIYSKQISQKRTSCHPPDRHSVASLHRRPVIAGEEQFSRS
ncbi:hypothetical protein ETAA8_68470 [Anatilimnocola aggregata]|uniref:Fatty acid desaturase domain-containing protein n=1 Tax=Anatilimnocola aggregata TaxID=2528021 RepID=A0A517YN80_9BACT|nr:hypothetical protein ETAA8_68470 [Anatilimnocola aggregata]